MDLHSTLLNALDDLSLTRASIFRRRRALTQVERVLAQACVSSNPNAPTELSLFLKLQDGFECNIASRLLSFLSQILPTLQTPGDSDVLNDEEGEEFKLEQTVVQALSILQGVALLHGASKAYLGRKWAIELLLTLLTISRPRPPELPTNSPTKSPMKRGTPGSATSSSSLHTLPAAVIDALLCVLVDAPPALRIFEEVDGLEVVVKTMKRTGVERDVRLKCLEFLYWYLLPEAVESRPPSETSPIPPVPPLPQNILSAARLVQPTLSWSSSSSSSSEGPTTPPSSPTRAPRLAMLRKDLDFMPTTPKKPHVARLGLGTPMKTPFNAMRSPTKRRAALDDTPPLSVEASPTKRRFPAPSTPRMLGRERSVVSENSAPHSHQTPRVVTKSTQEKKEMLGGLLGNVDALVDGVAKAGIWGLG